MLQYLTVTNLFTICDPYVYIKYSLKIFSLIHFKLQILMKMPCETLVGMYRIVVLKKLNSLCYGFYDHPSFPDQTARRKGT